MKTETTIRHAREAIGLIMDGAIRHIESDYGPDESEDRQPFVATLFENAHMELDDWECTVSWRDMYNLVADMGAVLAPDSNVSDAVREWCRVMLVKYDLLP